LYYENLRLLYPTLPHLKHILLLFVQIFGIVQSTNEFNEQHKVMDGCSDLIMDVFGKPVGYHARSAIGTSTLPLNMSVEVEAIVQIKN
jgi:enamine deaminase RidA (YjgF/YER057c/UK114 family)